MARFKKITMLVGGVAMAALLAACGNIGSSTGGGTASTNSNQAGVQTTGQISKSEYSGVIKNGHYLTSNARGLTATTMNNTFNLTSFEGGLLNISKQFYDPANYIFQEGQYLSGSTLRSWLGRKSKNNPNGLNPKDNGKKDDSRNPIYVQSIEEQDFMQKNGDNLVLKGITIGIAMNAIDYYQKEQYGATFKQNISKAAMQNYGNDVAKQVVQRLRKTRGISSDLPIVVAMYVQAPTDNLSGGTFYASTQTKSSTIDNWNKLDVVNKVFPLIGASTKDFANNDSKSFQNFQSQVENFFPTVSDITAQAQYLDQKIQGEHVTITTQFYSQTEIISFTNFVAQVAPKFLPSGVPVDITINSANGIQAFLSRNSNDRNFESHVFTSY
ncbi:CamS family sex pheromone protein [Periweissella fabalis]|uniref:CamS family sex pheromone protein n=1 Tax=Periweissella fabalis TaxID=1070421 RepID=A0A7X6N2X4_9LACO|nr:CamS family sex pheromone protein [Periweissella fabalis]MCM0598684.1 CamS family sex pheromone protein [Periweissella fabalis]NKZ24337.1 CamS family sex pheromone protein [Periweissella fabalis]